MSEPPERLCLYLPNSFSRHVEIKADFLERKGIAVIEPESHLEDLLFPRRKRRENAPELFLKEGERRLVCGILDVLILDKIAKKGVFLLAYRSLEDIGSRATFLTCLTRLTFHPSCSAISSSVGSRPSRCIS